MSEDESEKLSRYGILELEAVPVLPESEGIPGNF